LSCSDCRPQQIAILEAQHCIRDSEVWIGSRVYGFSGEMTNQMVVALETILASDDAKNILISLVDSAQPTGQLYALCGLYHINDSGFSGIAERFRGNTNLVDTISADTLDKERICDIVFSPYGDRKGETNVVLQTGQTVSDWLNEHDKSIQPFMDISGGAIPMMLLYGLGGSR